MTNIIGWSILCNGEHTGNFFAYREAAEVRMIEMNRKYPDDVRVIRPIFDELPERPAPCARHCEANAFKIEIRQLKAALAQARRDALEEAAEYFQLNDTNLFWGSQAAREVRALKEKA